MGIWQPKGLRRRWKEEGENVSQNEGNAEIETKMFEEQKEESL
jgi:hypothetical protein